jgi:hypothetical protein
MRACAEDPILGEQITVDRRYEEREGFEYDKETTVSPQPFRKGKRAKYQKINKYVKRTYESESGKFEHNDNRADGLYGGSKSANFSHVLAPDTYIYTL